jgi:signal transduction histidine kinase
MLRWLREHPRGADAILAGAVAALSVAIHVVGSGLGDVLELQEPTWWSLLLVLAASAPVAWRRTHPISAAYVIVFAQSAMEITRVEGTGWLGLIIALYSVGAHSDHPRRAVAAGGLLAAIGALLASGVILDEIGPGTVISTVAIVVAALLFGDNVRRRRQHLDDLAERTERAEREQELRARERVRDERARIARELHDVVAHSVSVMIIQAGAARRSLPERPDDAIAMLHEVEGSGRRAMDELRRVLGVLRADDSHDGTDEPPVLGPQPGLDDLWRLVADDPDLPVTLRIDPAARTLPERRGRVGVPARARGAHERPPTRRPGRARVGDHRSDRRGCSTSSSTTTAAGAAGRPDATPDGFGIAGMHERVHALGGTVTAGAAPRRRLAGPRPPVPRSAPRGVPA